MSLSINGKKVLKAYVGANEAKSLSIGNVDIWTKYAIAISVSDSSATGASSIVTDQTATIIITPDEGYKLPESITVTGASYTYEDRQNIGYITLSNATADIYVSVICEQVETAYTIGFTGMSQSTPALTRTDSAIGATWAASNGVIEVTHIDTNKIWAGYESNDGEALTWDAANNQFLKDGVAYAGNVFSVFNRFFAKPIYEEVDGVQVLDGYQLIFATTQPEGTEDWFYGKDHISIGCYKAKNANGSSALTSVKGIGYASTSNAEQIVASYKLASTTSGNLHEKWFNENAILQVLFMAIFATRQTEDVFPQGTYRSTNDSKHTGYMDSMRSSSSIATGYTTEYSSGANGNMFFGIEDFVGFGYELVAGVVLSGTNVKTTRDFASFAYSNSYDDADINLSSFTSENYIKSLQESSTIIGLLIPKIDTGNSSTATDYFCDKCWIGGNCWYQGAIGPDAPYGVFSTRCNYSSSLQDMRFDGRLCRTPA